MYGMYGESPRPAQQPEEVQEAQETPTTSADAWQEVGQQFRALGETLAAAFRATFDSDEGRQRLDHMRTGVEAMVHEVERAVQDAAATPEAQQVRGEVKKAARSARVAGQKTLEEVRPHLISALQEVNRELQKMVDRMDHEPAAGDETVEVPDVPEATDVERPAE